MGLTGADVGKIMARIAIEHGDGQADCRTTTATVLTPWIGLGVVSELRL
jgi:hypothetical protein